MASVFEGKPQVSRYWDNSESAYVDLVSCADQPCDDVTSFGTVGLSDYPLVQDGKEFPARLEIVGAVASDTESFAEILTSAAFHIINQKWFCCPGSILQNAICIYDQSLEMKHLLFTSPFLWDDFASEDFENITVAWLLAIPISDNEKLYADENGYDKLENLFEEKEIDVFDLERASIL